MSDTLILEFLGLVVTAIAVITPVIKLNGSIVRLSAAVDALEKTVEKNSATVDSRLAEHGNEIDALQKVTAAHDIRIGHLEERNK